MTPPMGESRLGIPLILGIFILGTLGFYPLANADVGDIILADNDGRLLRVTPLGDVTEILTGLVKPSGVAINSNGDIIFTESSRLLMVQSNGGGLSVIADSGIGTPLGVKIDSDENFIVVDNMGRLLKVTSGGTVSVIASAGLSGAILDVAFDLNGDYVVTDSSTEALLRVTPGGSVSTIADGFFGLRGVDVDSNGNFIVTTTGQLLKVTPDGNTITQIAAIPGLLFGVAIDSDDSILLSEQTTGSLHRVVNGVPTLIVNNLGNPLFFDIEQFVIVDVQFFASLDGSQEVPPVSTTGTGIALFELNEAGTEISFQIQISNLDLGGQTVPTTDDVTGAHIHLAPLGVNGGVVVGFINPSTTVNTIDVVAGTIVGTIDSSSLTGSLAGQPLSDLVNEMISGNTYVNIHTIANAGGEIRGQIEPCLPPSSGNWVVDFDCTLVNSAVAPANVTIQGGSVLTIPSGLSLDIDFTQFNLTVVSGSGVLIKAGGAIT